MTCLHLVNRILLLTNVQWIQRFWRIVGYREVIQKRGSSTSVPERMTILNANRD
jgi:hypothetical protein